MHGDSGNVSTPIQTFVTHYCVTREEKKLQRCEGAKEIDPLSSCCRREMAEVIAFFFLHRFAQMKNEVTQSLAFSILTRF